MKRVLIIHELYGSAGGAEQNIADASRALQGSFDMHMLYARSSGKETAAWNTLFKGSYALEAFSTEAVLKKVQPHFIFVHKCLSAAVLEAVSKSGIRHAHMVHDHEGYCMRNYKYFPWSRRICHKKAGLCCLFPCLASLQRARGAPLGVKWVSYQEQQDLIRADHLLEKFLVASAYMQQELVLQGYDPERIEVVPPVPSPLPSNEETQVDNLLLFVGQVVRGKGLDVLLQALKRVKTPAHLRVIGSGSHLPYCRELAATLPSQHRVEFLDFLPREELAIHYQQCAFLVVPSVWPEPFGMVGIEAMRFSRPVIGFDSGGIRDWLKNEWNGYLIPWMDEGEMTNQIERLLRDPAHCQELGKKGRHFVDEQYAFSQYIERLRLLFS